MVSITNKDDSNLLNTVKTAVKQVLEKTVLAPTRTLVELESPARRITNWLDKMDAPSPNAAHESNGLNPEYSSITSTPISHRPCSIEEINCEVYSILN